ncbi:eclosion hormone [Anabrus simplex]|uniref:eclosion hormone n=1 Tax=Anabrus simplex TaxID=316456 RepID=UPI0035A3080A
MDRRMSAVAIALLLLLTATTYVLADASAIGVCIRNCAQCKKMFGTYFEGQLCADACVKFKGKLIPDCEDINSIAPFLNKME